MSFDEILDAVESVIQPLVACADIVAALAPLEGLRSRLSGGEIHIAILGQFNRGKSTVINKLVGVDVLPTSVLPLTSLPTELRYGTELQTTITFANGDEKTVRGLDLSHELLRECITEKYNPENVAGVTRAVVQCPSALLAHGTVILDTPGFGSTHIHNTTTTLSVLPDCDAVFFVLSADLPITQMELNFIRRIAPHTSRLFFIYNKIDLFTTEEEREITVRFIQDTLKEKAGIDTTGRFYSLSTRESFVAGKEGVAHVLDEVISFLHREKYFSLSEALNQKLRAVLTQLLRILDEKTGVLNKELTQIREAQEAVQYEQVLLHKSLAEYTCLYDEFLVAFDRFVDNEWETQRSSLTYHLQEKGTALIEQSSFYHLSDAFPVLNYILEELALRFRTRLINGALCKFEGMVHLHKDFEELSVGEFRFVPKDSYPKWAHKALPFYMGKKSRTIYILQMFRGQCVVLLFERIAADIVELHEQLRAHISEPFDAPREKYLKEDAILSASVEMYEQEYGQKSDEQQSEREKLISARSVFMQFLPE